MASASKCVERHMVLWDLKRRLQDLHQRPGRCIHKGVAYGPCLLISRERGSGGSTIARLAGERLGWQVFDREILDEIANLAHVRAQLADSVAEPARSRLETDWQSALKPEHIDDEAYYRYLRQVVMTLGHHGDVVLVGRGAHYLLPSGAALRVRVIAPLERRIDRMAALTKQTLPEAKTQIEKFDAEREAFVRNWFQRDARFALNYDLTINTAEVSLPAAAHIVVNALHDKLGVHILQPGVEGLAA